jgi:hypothetical protein
MVVGIRARTTQFTSGRMGRSFGFLAPQPPFTTVESTGTDLGMCRDGVVVPLARPGVDGGVNAGETRPGRECESGVESPSMDPGAEGRCASAGWDIERELRSSSEIARETGIGRGE